MQNEPKKATRPNAVVALSLPIIQKGSTTNYSVFRINSIIYFSLKPRLSYKLLA